MTKYSLMVAVLAASSFAIACGGSSDDSPNAETELPLVEGLDSDADNQRLLFYVSTAEDAPGLYAFDPTRPAEGGILVDDDLHLLNPHYASLKGGTIDRANERISDYHTTDIYYTTFGTPPTDGALSTPTMYGEQWRISTDPARLGEGPTRVSDTTISAAVLSSVARFHAFDFNDPMNTSVAIDSVSDGWIRVRPGYDATHESDKFGENIRVASTIYDPEAQGNAGWLVFDTGTDDQGNSGILRRLDDELNPLGDVHYKDSGEPVINVKQVKYLHGFGDGTVLLALGIDSTESGDVWLYESGAGPGNGGTIKALLNADGEPMTISFAFMGLDGDEMSISAPSAGLTNVTADSLYFAQGPSMFAPVWTHLFRIDHEGWAAYDHKAHFSGNTEGTTSAILNSNLGGFLIALGENKLFWSLGGQNEIVDVSSQDPAQWTRTPIDAAGDTAEGTTVYSSASGWVYYNSTSDEAVALNVHTGESVALKNATWLGASATGEMDTYNGRRTHQPISEVFLLRNGRQLAAVEAANPLEGMVVLGELSENTSAVQLFGVAAGPHRLAQVEYDDGTFGVVYMNTRQSDSLKQLMTEAAADWQMPLEGEYEFSADVLAEQTRPLDGF